MEQLTTLRRQLESEHRRQRLFEQATRPLVNRKVVYPEILELCRELKWQLEELRGLIWARCAMHLTSGRLRNFSLFTFSLVKLPRNAEIKILFAVARTLLLTPIMPMGLTVPTWPNYPFWCTIYICTIRNSALTCSGECTQLFFSG